MGEVTLHAQGAITGTGRIQPNVQASTSPEEISLWQTYGPGDPNDCRDHPIQLRDGSTVYISNNQLETITEGLRRNPAAYPELDEGVRTALAGTPAPPPAAPAPAPAPSAPPGQRLGMNSPAVQTFLASIPPANRDQVAAQLQQISNRGQLTGELVDQLSALRDPNRTPFPPGAEGYNTMMFNNVLRDLADPTSISQCEQTCASARARSILAMRDSTRYVQIVRDLVSPEGVHAGPPMMRRPANVPAAQLQSTGMAMEPALTELAGRAWGERMRASTSELLPWRSNTGGIDGGLSQGRQLQQLRDLLGLEYELQTCKGIPGFVGDLVGLGSHRVFENIKCAAAEGHAVPVTVNWGGENHAVLFLGTTRDQNGQEFAVVVDPSSGERKRIPADVFRDKLQEAYLPQGAANPPYRPNDWDDLNKTSVPDFNQK